MLVFGEALDSGGPEVFCDGAMLDIARRVEVKTMPVPFVVSLVVPDSVPEEPRPEHSTHYQRLVGGPPASSGMKAGAVVLELGASVGEHVSAAKEETLVVLEGEAELVCEGFPPLRAAAPAVLYVPAETKHNVKNVGVASLRYVYVTAPVGPCCSSHA